MGTYTSTKTMEQVQQLVEADVINTIAEHIDPAIGPREIVATELYETMRAKWHMLFAAENMIREDYESHYRRKNHD